MSQYATTTDLVTYAIKAEALTGISTTMQNLALVAASAEADSYLKGRYALPLLAWDAALSNAVARIAAYMLIKTRGFNPQSAADINFRLGYEDAIRWLRDVERQNAHPDLTPSPSQVPTYNAPQVFTTNGRGW
jgi:phage gp36-like protein